MSQKISIVVLGASQALVFGAVELSLICILLFDECG